MSSRQVATDKHKAIVRLYTII